MLSRLCASFVVTKMFWLIVKKRHTLPRPATHTMLLQTRRLCLFWAQLGMGTLSLRDCFIGTKLCVSRSQDVNFEIKFLLHGSGSERICMN